MRDNIIRLFGNDQPDLPEMEMPGQEEAQARPAGRQGTQIDLSGQPKLVMAFGAGSAGKSTLIRWAIDRVKLRGDGAEPPALATLDAERPTLKRFFPDAMAPHTAAGAMTFLEQLLNHVLTHGVTTIVDFPADQTLAPLLRQMPGLIDDMRAAGVEPVTLFVMTPREADLTVLSVMERTGFQAPATALVLNLGRTVSPGDDAWMEFTKVRRHSTYKAALDRGATEVWMPRLFAASAVEDRALGFTQAVTGEGVGERLQLQVLDRTRVRGWLGLMEDAFRPVLTWLP